MENNNGHPTSYNTGNPDKPVVSYEEYKGIKEDEENGTINQSSDNA